MLVFVHINKTAGSTVRYILRSSYGPRHCDVEPWRAQWDEQPFSAADLRRVRRFYPKLASIAGHRITGHVDLDDDGSELAYFTVLREPIALCASRFQYHVDHRGKRDLVFDDWIQRDWLRNAQTTRIAGTPNASEAIRVIERRGMFVGLTERFDESLVLLRALRAADLRIDYEAVNVARRNAIASDLLSNPRTRQAIVDANREDLELYAYVKDDLYPAFQREFGPSLPDALAGYRGGSERAFDRRNLAMCRLKQKTIYGPLLRLYRSGATRPMVERLLG